MRNAQSSIAAPLHPVYRLLVFTGTCGWRGAGLVYAENRTRLSRGAFSSGRGEMVYQLAALGAASSRTGEVVAARGAEAAAAAAGLSPRQEVEREKNNCELECGVKGGVDEQAGPNRFNGDTGAGLVNWIHPCWENEKGVARSGGIFDDLMVIFDSPNAAGGKAL